LRYLFIVNPTSGKGKGKKVIPQIIDHCSHQNIDYEIIETKYRLHATDIVKDKLNKFEIIISVGGDGTLNEVINGFDGKTKSILGVLPVGSGNDFTKNIGFTNKVEHNLNILTNNNYCIKSVDVGYVEISEELNNEQKFHRFINNCGIGFDAYVGHLNQTNKKLSGILSYIYAVIKALFNYHIMEANIKINDFEIKGRKLLISVGNGICSGGGFYLNPDAKINDGMLDFTILDAITRRRLLSALPLALINRVKSVKEANFYKSNGIEIKLENPYYIHCDGEIVSTKCSKVKMLVEQNAIKVITNN
jgi:YegS/Rv2252/BmrU family lipid kinase